MEKIKIHWPSGLLDPLDHCDWKCLAVRVGLVNNFALTNASVSLNLVSNDPCAVQI